MISIVSLIYKSKTYADSVFNSLHKYTPMLKSGNAEFYFIANDATADVLRHLDLMGYNYYINNNNKYTELELFDMGYAKPEYIHRVYRGWNEGIKHGKDIVVLVNSDNIFSANWLENLLKWSAENRFVCSKIVERNHPKYGVFPGAYEADCGSNPLNFKEDDFIKFCKQKIKHGISSGGAYMPCMFYKKMAEKVGYYPEGNVRGDSFDIVKSYGDEEFVKKLSNIGVKHITSLDSISYHFKEGEMEFFDIDR